MDDNAARTVNPALNTVARLHLNIGFVLGEMKRPPNRIGGDASAADDDHHERSFGRHFQKRQAYEAECQNIDGKII